MDKKLKDVPCLAEFLPRSDGTWTLRPTLPQEDADSWVSIRQAAKVLGISEASAYKLKDAGFMVHRRPLKGKITVSLRWLMQFRRATADEEFWQNCLSQKSFRDQVRSAQEKLLEMALQGL